MLIILESIYSTEYNTSISVLIVSKLMLFLCAVVIFRDEPSLCTTTYTRLKTWSLHLTIRTENEIFMFNSSVKLGCKGICCYISM